MGLKQLRTSHADSVALDAAERSGVNGVRGWVVRARRPAAIRHKKRPAVNTLPRPAPGETMEGEGAIPAPVTSLIARETEIADAVTLLAGGARLLTFTGPAGVGKTRLAVAVAAGARRLFADGAWFVDLADCRDADSCVAALATALPRALGGGTAATSTSTIARERRRVLLVLDNAEQ